MGSNWPKFVKLKGKKTKEPKYDPHKRKSFERDPAKFPSTKLTSTKKSN